jgi:hypothetical protein
MRRALLFLGFLSAFAGEADPYRYDTFEGAPIVWPEARAVVYFDPATVPPAFVPSLDSALGTWSAVPGSAFRFEPGGATPSADVRDTQNGNSDCWFDPSVPSFAYAMTFLGSVDGKIVERDIAFGSSKAWTLTPLGIPGGPSDFETVALHELGHVLGLQHETVPSVMDVSRQPHIATRSLYPDDEDGVRYLYPGGTPGAPDLRVTDVTFGEGDPLPVSWRMENRGGTASGAFPAGVWLCTSTHRGPEDRFLGEATEAGLAGGAARDGARAVPRPPDLLPGSWRVRVELAPEADAAFFDNRAVAAEYLLVERPAAPLAPGQTATGALGPVGRDGFTLALPGPARLMVSAGLVSGPMEITLVPPGASEPAFEVRGDLRARMKAVTGAGGAWILFVASAEWARTDYALDLRAGPVKSSGVILLEAPAILEIPGFAGGTVTVNLAPAPGMSLAAELLDPAGSVKAAGRGLRVGPVTVPETGEVLLRLDPGAGPGGTVSWRARAKPGRRLGTVAR